MHQSHTLVHFELKEIIVFIQIQLKADLYKPALKY